jgi:cell division protein FtsW
MEISKKGHLDWYILLSVIGLMLFSIAFVFSASAQISAIKFGDADKMFINHLSKIAIGLVLLFVFAKIDYHIYQKYSKYFILLALVPLILVFVISVPVNNVYRWIDIGPFNFQPSELAKFALVIHLSTLLAERQEYIKSFKYGMLPLLIWSSLIAGLIAVQPNFSTAFVTYIIALSLMFIGNVNILHLGAVGACSLSIAGIFAISASYRMNRFMTFLGTNSSENFDKFGYQTSQAILAFGNGGISGIGAGQSRQSNLFLPESYGDFIYSIIGEEYGFIGAFLILIVFGLIIWRGIKIIKNAPDEYGYFLASGLVITFCLYAVVNAGVNCGLFPNTGVPMPFVSWGGTAVFIYASAIGILLNISAQSGVFPFKKKTETEESL